jgi:hypothetical protein
MLVWSEINNNSPPPGNRRDQNDSKTYHHSLLLSNRIQKAETFDGLEKLVAQPELAFVTCLLHCSGGLHQVFGVLFG